MENNKQPIRSFTQLIVWQQGHKLVLEVYNATKGFPKEELFALISQVRRAVVSITCNIAEGFSRTSYKDKAHFYSIALGSLTETQNLLLIARDLGYINKTQFDSLAAKTVEIQKMLTVLIKNSRAKSS